MQVAPIPGLDDDVNLIRQQTAEIVDKHIIPNENALRSGGGETRKKLYQDLQRRAKQAGSRALRAARSRPRIT